MKEVYSRTDTRYGTVYMQRWARYAITVSEAGMITYNDGFSDNNGVFKSNWDKCFEPEVHDLFSWIDVIKSWRLG